ncbi:MAG: FAD-dependent oxidoreductase [Pirellulaceae bacterium]|nr:FAD-dependent oxidoreductase [Pirellulaceae bacterium]
MATDHPLSRRGLFQAAGAAGLGSLWSAAASPAGGAGDGNSVGEAAAASSAGPTIAEPARQIPVAADCDVCVVGGSCTGVFAAVAAARLGAKVVLIESNGFFGGVATASLVNLWHSTEDMENQQQIIAGLSTEVFERLDRRNSLTVVKGKRTHYALNTEELKIELDALITEANVRPMLHAMFVATIVEDGRIAAAVIEDKSGRRAIRARQFIDATGDADVVARTGMPIYQRDTVQPPTMCVILRGLEAIRRKHPDFNIHRAIFDAKYPQALQPGFSWGRAVPGGEDEYMLAGTRVFNANCAEADELTEATIEGRRQVRAICDLLREHFMDGQGTPLLTLPAKIGIREGRHAQCLHTLTQDELLDGRRFPDAIANGTYPVDIHNASGGGITFRYLEKTPFYQIPYSSLVPRGAHNILVAGRSIDADEGAFGAVRVMINCNQMGQAAGVAAWLALDSGKSVADIDTHRLRETLKQQGAAIL